MPAAGGASGCPLVARVGAVVLCSVGLALVASAASARGAGDVCLQAEPVASGGTIGEPRLIELSGLASSRHHPDVLWGHNDSGGTAELYAVAEDGTSLGAY